MQALSKLTFAAATLLVVVGSSLLLPASEERVAEPVLRASLPVRALVLARPFTLARATEHVWRAEPVRYDAGWLVVLDVDPTFVVPRQTAEPVLQAGMETVERVNHGDRSGRVVGIVPSMRGPDGRPVLDLGTTTFFFGPEELPERLSGADLQRALVRARASGARPFPADEIAAALARGGEVLDLESRDDLDPIAGLLILDHAPEDVDVATGLLAPRVR